MSSMRSLADNPQQKLKTFELATVTYGTASASFLVIRSLQKLAEDKTILYPLGSKIVLKDFYIDDMLTGASTLSEHFKYKESNNSIASKWWF